MMLGADLATRNPATRVLAVSFFVFVLYWLYARSHFIRDPGSAFYDSERAFDRFYGNSRLAEAEDFLARPLRLNETQERIAAARKDVGPCLCTTVTTVKRDTPRPYVYNTIASILANLTLAERASLRLNLLFTDMVPNDHEAFNDDHLSGLVDNVFTYDSLQVPQEKKQELEFFLQEGRIKDKSINDYATALQLCMTYSSCPYVSVVEEDVLLADSWLARTHASLELLSTETEDWLDMRLFNQEDSIGWASKTIGRNNELLITLVIVAGVLLVTLILWKFRPASRKLLTKRVLAVVCLFTIPVSVILFFQSGKASLLPPRPGVRFQFFGCCSQAMVFKRQHVPGLIEFLLQGVASPLAYDMLTRNFAWVNKLQRAAQYPVMAQHIGTQSASQNVNSSKVWSMAFEQLDKSSLSRDHMALHDQVWGPSESYMAYYE